MTPPTGILRAESGLLAGQSFALDRSPFNIGRGADNNLVVPDTPVSRRHACLELQGDCWFLRDLGSSNGTFLNRQAIKETPQPLRNGDLVGIGDSVFVFTAQAPQAVQAQGRRAQPVASQRGRSGWVVAAVIAVVLVALVVAAVLLFGGSSGKGGEGGSTPVLPSIDLPTIQAPTGFPTELAIPTGELSIPTGLPAIPSPKP